MIASLLRQRAQQDLDRSRNVLATSQGLRARTGSAIERATALRKRVAASAAALAAAEDKVAEMHEMFASQRHYGTDEHGRIAAAARTAAQEARKIENKYSE